MSKYPRAWIELHAGALLNNLEQVRRSSDAAIIAVVKANAYGHGMKFVSRLLEPGVKAFAVAALNEALSLRALFAEKPVILLSGFYQPEQLAVLQSQRITPVIFNAAQIAWMEAANVYGMPVGLKIDTGMGRLGINPDFLLEAITRLQALGCEITLMSHFASADDPAAAQNEVQHQVFKTATRPYSYSRSFANSAAIVSRPQDHYDMVRPGIMLYGASPLQGVSAAGLELQPVMHLYARLLDIKHLQRGDSVGYGATWVADEACMLGIVSIGYGDGYPRVVRRGAQVAIAGRRYEIVGRVSMDTLAVKLDSVHRVHIGDRVELWGEIIAADEVADWAGTIAYELFCKIMPRVERKKRKSGSGKHEQV